MNISSKCYPTFMYNVKCIIQQHINFNILIPSDSQGVSLHVSVIMISLLSPVLYRSSVTVRSAAGGLSLSLSLSPLCLSCHTMTRSQVVFELPCIRQLIKAPLSAEATSTPPPPMDLYYSDKPLIKHYQNQQPFD